MDIEEMVQETFHNYHKGVVLIIKRGANKIAGASSGFIIGREGTTYLVMTCSHCVSLSSDLKLSVRIPGDTKEYEATEMFDDKGMDLAIIKIMDVPEDCPVLRFQDLEQNIPANTPIVQLGYILPQGISYLNLEPSASPGTTIALYENGAKNVVYTAATKHGCSGSALLMNSKVIGVVYSMALRGQPSFARSSTTVAKVFRGWLRTDDVLTIEEMVLLLLQKI